MVSASFISIVAVLGAQAAIGCTPSHVTNDLTYDESNIYLPQYKRLSYHNFRISIVEKLGFVPESGSRVILTSASPFIAAPIDPSFDVHGFYFACYVNAGLTNIPVACNLDVKGFNDKNKLFSTQRVTFQPDTPVSTTMHFADVDGNFDGTKRLEFSYRFADAIRPAGSLNLVLDNFQYTLNQCN